MKIFISIFPFLFWSCKNSTTKTDSNPTVDTTITRPISKDTVISLPKSKVDRAKYHTNKDTVVIYCCDKDTLKYSKAEFNDIIDNFPELYSRNTTDPYKTYCKDPIYVDLEDSSGNKDRRSFSSEAGQDEYYILYAYFLKNKNGIAKYAVRRNKLLKIYRDLNSLFGNLYYGGTYYGHQYSRIEGFAEFSVYWFDHYEDWFDRPYDITKQKNIYIAGLKQLVRDEVAIDNYVNSKKDKEKRVQELLETIDDLDKLITDNFYLRMSQSFQSDHY